MTERWIPKDKTELLAGIEREWKLLLETVEPLTDVQMSMPDAGGWSPKDNLAHLTEWMNILMGYHMDKRSGVDVTRLPQDVVNEWDLEVVNRSMFERNKDRSREDVMSWMNKTYDELIAKLESASFETLLVPRYADDPHKLPLLAFVLGNTTEHFQEHRETIEREFKQA